MSKQSKGKAVKRKQVRSSSEEGSRSGRESNQSGEDDQQGSLRDAQMRALKAERLTENQDQQIRALQAKLKEYAARTSKKQKRAAAGGGGPSNRRSETPVDQHADPPNQRPVNANQQAPPAPVQPNAKLLDDDYNRVLVRMAGRRCCVLHNPFLEPDFLTDNTVQQALPQIIKDLESKIAGGSEAGSDAEGGDHPGGDEDFWATLRFELAQPVDIVREILSTLPIELGRLWLNPRFQKLFHTGYRKMKSEAVSGVANARLVVFKMTEEEFGQRSDDRKRGAAAQALFEKHRYMVIPAARNANGNEPPRSPRWFRHECLINACQVILAGLSAAESASDRASTKARKSRGAMWKVTGVTPSILTFTSIVVHFVLSGDPEFLARSRSTDFMALWDKRMELLEKHHRNSLTDYNNMTRLFNLKVFPKHHQPPEQGRAAVLGEEERELEQELGDGN